MFYSIKLFLRFLRYFFVSSILDFMGQNLTKERGRREDSPKFHGRSHKFWKKNFEYFLKKFIKFFEEVCAFIWLDAPDFNPHQRQTAAQNSLEASNTNYN